MRTPQVCVVGSANADLVLDIDHRPAPGETIIGSDLLITAGGKGANQAVAAGKLGGRVAFLGCVGDDEHGRLLRESLTAAGVDLSGLRTVDTPTGVATIMITPDGENSIIVSPGANRCVTPVVLEELRSTWTSTAVVVLQLEVPIESVVLVATHAPGRVILNAAPAATLPRAVLDAADPLVVNESEAAFLLRDSPDGPALSPSSGDVEETVRRLLDLGPRSVVLTVGAAGSVLAEAARDDGEPRLQRIAAQRVSAVDTTGAGDSFVGALAVRLADGATLPDAVQLATSVAALAVTRRGAQESFPTIDEVAAAVGEAVQG